MISLSSIFFLIIALLVVSFLIFIHELGHYWMARRVGMKVDTFSIGIGKPMYSWEHDGVKWQICWILFGGYVRIAGEESEEEPEDPSTYSSQSLARPLQEGETFQSKPPFDRIKVAAMGPIMNILFAILAFAFIWLLNGVQKPFSEYTHKIGWVDPSSELYSKGVRPGDEISGYGSHDFAGSKDHVTEPILAKERITVHGSHIDYVNNSRTPFTYDVALYPHPALIDKDLTTSGILAPARYLIYDPGSISNQASSIPQNESVTESGLKAGDRIVWVDGEPIFSLAQLNALINSEQTLLTVQRGNQQFLRRIARIPISEIKLDPDFKEELVDWQFEAGLNGTKLPLLKMIPYNLTLDCVVENEVRFIDTESQQEAFPKNQFSSLEQPLQAGDKIIAVDGTPVKFAYQLFYQLQNHKVSVIVDRNPLKKETMLWTAADEAFDKELDVKALNQLGQTIGTPSTQTQANNYFLLKPIIPVHQADLIAQSEMSAQYQAQLEEQTKHAEAIEDPEKRAQLLALLKKKQQELVLGIPGINDRMVTYNPPPTTLLYDVTIGFWRNLYALFTGAISPKWFMGPIGIVQVVQNSWMSGLQEGLFWMGFISMNLALFNLIPFPLLDGGTILFCLIEMISKKRMKPEIMEKVALISAIVLISFFLYISYNDILRTLKRFMSW